MFIRYFHYILSAVIISLVTLFLSKWQKQNNKRYSLSRKEKVLIGLIYGALACLSTWFGIDYEGAYIASVRDAAPIVAGLLFGPLSGQVAGSIGALFCAGYALAGVGQFTWLASSISCLLSGCIAAICNRYLFEGRRPEPYHGLFVVVSSVVNQMLLIIVTNLQKDETAYDVISHCTLPVIFANGLTVMLSMLLPVLLLYRGHLRPKVKKKKKIANIIAMRVYCILLCAYVLTSALTGYLHYKICLRNAEYLLMEEMQDIHEDMDTSFYEYVMDMALDLQSLDYTPSETAKGDTSYYQQLLKALAESYGMSDFYLMGEDGIVIVGSNPEYNGKMATQLTENAADILVIEPSIYAVEPDGVIKNDSPLEQNVAVPDTVKAVAPELTNEQPVNEGTHDDTHDETEADELYCIRFGLRKRGYMLGTYTKEQRRLIIREGLAEIASVHDIGSTGFSFFYDRTTHRPLHSELLPNVEGNMERLYSEAIQCETSEIQNFTADDGTNYVYVYSEHGEYIVFSVMTKEEMLYNHDAIMYINLLLLHEVFSALSLVLFLFLKRRVIDDLVHVNNTLERIGDGERDLVVDVRSSAEFSKLSDALNDTFDSLRQYMEQVQSCITQELNYARTIQKSLLPSVFPAFPEHDEFDVFASMKPAKEVGGDFYDFCLIGNHRLMFVIADVSGKGIPAAMLMMRARTLIRSYVEQKVAPNLLMGYVNNELCSGNEAQMFVTVWLGCLDFETGLLSYVNGGHNPPVLIRKGQEAEYLRKRSGLVLGGMSDVPYRMHELQLEEGDKLFLYTDGETEAFNLQGEQFGERRLLEVLNREKASNVTELCGHVEKAVNTFACDAQQSDDRTMLCVEFRHTIKKIGG